MPPFSITRVWYSFVALPAFQLMMYRALWRWLLWSWLLARISRERLRPEPAHPDGSGGLGFLGDGALRFAPVAAAYSVVLAGAWGGLILHRDARFVEPCASLVGEPFELVQTLDPRTREPVRTLVCVWSSGALRPLRSCPFCGVSLPTEGR